MPKAEPLARHRRYRSHDLEAVRALIYEEFGLNPIRMAQRSSRADVRINCVRLPHMHVSYVQYGASVEVQMPGPLDRYRLLLPLRGQALSWSDGESVVCDHRQAALMSPNTLSRTRSDARSTRIKLSISQDSMVRRLAALLGEAPVRPLVFRRKLDLGSKPGRSLAGFIAWSIEQFDQDDVLLDNPLMISQVEDWILTALLTQQPHSYSEAMARGGSALPRDVKRAIDYLRAHADQAVTIEDLVSVSGVAGRTLYKHFRDFAGCSPMAYLRKLRFERVHAELQQADPRASVTDLALKWGFRHVGRFSVEYRRIFGESPSLTLGKRRGG